MPEPFPAGMDQVPSRSPYPGAVFFLLLFFLLSILGGGVAGSLIRDPLGLLMLSYLFIGAGAVVLLSWLGWWARAGFSSLGRRQDLLLYLLPAAVALVSLTEGVSAAGWHEVAMFAIFSLIVAWTEEAFFRGLILQTLLPAGTRIAVVVSAVLFGLPHVLNAFGGLWDPLFAIANTVAAFGIGITLAALVVRTGTIWPPILIHALVNFTALLSLGSLVVPVQTPLQLALTISAGVVLAAYGMFLIRGTGAPGGVKEGRERRM
ncbi:MAG: CPBP family intramembrane metalloprotease [Methanomicrobiales archaeon]|nr:CPBP family intramembrane metalloprotease [Methanomicrobiales archaeon]